MKWRSWKEEPKDGEWIVTFEEVGDEYVEHLAPYFGIRFYKRCPNPHWHQELVKHEEDWIGYSHWAPLSEFSLPETYKPRHVL